MRLRLFTLLVAAFVLGGAAPPALLPDAALPADASRLVVLVHGRDARAAEAAVAAAGLTRVTAYRAVGVVVAAGTPSAVRRVTVDPRVTNVESDTPLALATDTSHVATRAAEVHRVRDGRGRRLDGRGVTIAVIDSGIDATHPAFRRPNGRSAVVRNLKEVCLSRPREPYPDRGAGCFVDARDSDTLSTGGHGTHVAATAAASARRTADGRVLSGAAPGASLVGLSVAQLTTVYGAATGLNWVLEHHADPCGGRRCPPIRVVNNSYGPPGGGANDPGSAIDKLQQALVRAGVVVVWAAGNDGGDGERARTNAFARSPVRGVISVAAYDDADAGRRNGTIADTSSRGEVGAPSTHPDLAAPGVRIAAACRVTLPVCATGLDGRDLGTAVLSGTSMAAPHVAGIVALMLQERPRLTPAQVEDLLEDTARRLPGGLPRERDPSNPSTPSSADQGHGLVDAAAALAALRR